MNKNSSKSYRAICIRPPGKDVNDLIAAECENLTGGIPDADGVAVCHSVERVPQAAYVRTGLRCIAQASTFDGLLAAIRQADFDGTDFRVDVLQLSGHFPLSEQQTIVAVANSIFFYPKLKNPQHRFLVVAQADKFWFGEILAETAQSYVPHIDKPYHVSSSLPARIARALVNLIAPPAQSLIDPCCGTGSILIEAQSLGIETHGADKNPKMVGMARNNLAHFGYAPEVDYIDARKWQRTADALVTDLPYGRRLKSAANIIPGILEHAVWLAPIAIYVTGEDISTWLRDVRYHNIETFRIIKHNGFTRYVHRAYTDSHSKDLK